MIDPAFTLEKKIAIVAARERDPTRHRARLRAAGARVAAPTSRSRRQDHRGRESRPAAATRPVRLDVTDGASCRDAVAATIQRFGGLDVLMYGAADATGPRPCWRWTRRPGNRVIRINLTGAFLMVKGRHPRDDHARRRQHHPHRLAARPRGIPGRPAYCATKGALIQLAKVLAASTTRWPREEHRWSRPSVAADRNVGDVR